MRSLLLLAVAMAAALGGPGQAGGLPGGGACDGPVDIGCLHVHLTPFGPIVFPCDAYTGDGGVGGQHVLPAFLPESACLHTP